MNSNVLDVQHEDMHDFVVNINNINLKRADAGFVMTDCNYIKTMLATVCLHALENTLIFTTNRKEKIVEIINELGYGS